MQLSTALNLPNRQVSAGGLDYGASLSLDFTSGNQTLDSRITFTRASTATYFNSSGVLTTTGFNLLTYSEQFDNAAWIKLRSSVTPNTIVAPNGALTADALITDTTANDTHRAESGSIAFTSGTTYTLSLYVKAQSSLNLQLVFLTAAFGASLRAAYNLQTGQTLVSSSSITAKTTDVGNGWFRCEATATATATATSGFHISLINLFAASAAATSFTGDGTSGIYIWGAQLETGSIATTYIPTAASTSGAARFDYNPTTLAPLGLLIEESRTNLMTYSEQFDNAAWTTASPYSVSANTAISPDGTQDADSVILASGQTSFNQNVTRQVVTKAASAIQYTRSGYFKRLGTTTSVRLQDFGNSSTNAASVVVSLVDGSIVTAPSAIGGFSGASVAVTNAGNGWWRIAFTYTTDAHTSLTIRSFPYVGASVLTGDGSSGLLAWGAQLEAGAFATSYIPTVASQVTRAADNAVMTGTNFSSWYNAAEGTLYAQADSVRPVSQSPSTRVFQFDDGTANNNIRSAAAAVLQVINATVVQANLTPSPAITFDGAVFDFASAYKLNDFAASTGGVVSTDTSGTVPSVNQFSLGGGSGAGILNGHIRRIAYFNRRLSNAELQGITA